MREFHIEINERVFAKVIDSVKHCVAKDTNRPELEFIKMRVCGDKLTACACDGYRAARTTTKIRFCHNNINEFDFYIKPIKIKPSKSGINPIVIGLENNIVTVEVITDYGKIKYCFSQRNIKYFDIEKIYQDVKECDRKIGANPDYVKQALTALLPLRTKNQKLVVFETKEQKYSPFVIWAKDGECISEQLILPMRINEQTERN